MGSPCGRWHSQQTSLVASKFPSPTCIALQPVSFAQQLGRCNNRVRLPLFTRHRHSVLTLAAAKPQSQREGPEKTNFFTKLIRPLRDFGLGKSSLWEGGVGLFIFAGIGFALMLITWARGGQLGRRGKGYQAVLEFPLACGISTGTPVRIRGVPVGSVLSVQPSLEQVNVLVEIKEPTTVIPRNSLIEANQSGLIAESLIDITPQLPIPDYKEGKVVCRDGHIRGQPGVALDDLVYICTKIARQMDANGLSKVFDAAETATSAIEEARPLLENAVKLVDEITPLLNELRQGNLVGNLEALTKSASEAASDIHNLQTEVLTDENVKALRESVVTLTRTLEHIEGITGDVGVLTGDSKVKGNIRQLVEALSRLVSD
ncbi:MAG: ATP-binding cassette superfamily [Trebouxia sp. A1-2]|nr:MAG: ATP-binding cassette superfamily [Trebouxia sp. A1-2]